MSKNILQNITTEWWPHSVMPRFILHTHLPEGTGIDAARGNLAAPEAKAVARSLYSVFAYALHRRLSGLRPLPHSGS